MPINNGEVQGSVSLNYRALQRVNFACAQNDVAVIEHLVRPGEAGRGGMEYALTPRNLVCHPAGANPARPRVSPPGPVASLAPETVTDSAMRRYASEWAVRYAATKEIYSGCRGSRVT